MSSVRLLPVIISDILLAAHFLRFYGFIPAVIILLLLLTLILRRKWIPRLWQGLLFIGTLMWIDTTANLLQIRLAMEMPWMRLLVIMGAVILFTIFSGFWLENKKLKSYFASSD